MSIQLTNFICPGKLSDSFVEGLVDSSGISDESLVLSLKFHFVEGACPAFAATRYRVDISDFIVAARVLDSVAKLQQKRDVDMLILTRRVGETLMIGDDVTVTVLGVKGNQIRIGVNAPKDVAVHREEIYLRIQAEEDADKASS